MKIRAVFVEYSEERKKYYICTFQLSKVAAFRQTKIADGELRWIYEVPFWEQVRYNLGFDSFQDALSAINSSKLHHIPIILRNTNVLKKEYFYDEKEYIEACEKLDLENQKC